MAHAGTIDGKGVYCPYDGGVYSFWFVAGKVLHRYIEGYEIVAGPLDENSYEEVGTRKIDIAGSSSYLYRDTLRHSDNQCYLVNNFKELLEKLDKYIATAKAKNKL